MPAELWGAKLALQVRHRGNAVPARIRESHVDGVTLSVLGELFAAGRGQSGVLYAGDRVLGGGIISSATQDGGDAGGKA